MLCQITSRQYDDECAERPAKLFTAHADLVVTVVGTVHDDARHRVVAAVVHVLQSGGVTEHR